MRGESREEVVGRNKPVALCELASLALSPNLRPTCDPPTLPSPPSSSPSRRHINPGVAVAAAQCAAWLDGAMLDTVQR